MSKEELISRFKAIEDVSLAKHLAGLDIAYPNNEILLKNIVDNEDIEKLELLESKRSEVNLFVIRESESIEALKYLKDTDYLVIKSIELGIEMDQEVKQQRAAARLKVL